MSREESWVAAFSSFQAHCPISFHPRHQGTSGGGALLGCLWATTPGGKPRILDLNRPKRERAVCWSRALPCRHARGFPNPGTSGAGGPAHRGLQEAMGQETSLLCQTRGSFPFLCILLATLYPVWEFQEHLRLSLAQPHVCKPSGSIVSLPAGALSSAVNWAEKPIKPGLRPHLQGSSSLPHPTPARGTKTDDFPVVRSCGSEGLFEQPRSSGQTDGAFLTVSPGLCFHVGFCVARSGEAGGKK